MAETLEQGKIRNSLWPKKRTKLENVLCLVTVISLLLVAFMVASLAFVAHLYYNSTALKYKCHVSYNSDKLLQSEDSSANLCLTPGCVKAATTLLMNMNESVDPCSDFYRFSCGGFLERNSIPDDKSSVSTYDTAVDKFNLQLKSLLETKLDGTEPSFITMTKEVYDMCMDLEVIENSGSQPLKAVLRLLGGWPVVEGRKWHTRKFDWVKSIISIRNLGYNHNILLSLYVNVDWRSNEFNIIKLDQPSFGVPDRTYLIHGLNDSTTAAYYKKMLKTAILLGADETKAERELLEALQFEMELAKYSLSREERRNISTVFDIYTIKELQEMTPQIPWLQYIDGLVMNEVNENEVLVVHVPECIKQLAVLIGKTEKRVIANYIMWRVVADSLPLLSKEWREIAFEFDKVLTGKNRENPRWEQCLSQLRSNLGIALTSYYVSHYFKVETKNEVSIIAKYVHKEFLHILEEIDWMDEKTKTHAKAKANSMIFYIGYAEELLNNTAVMEHYQNLTISNDSYFENVLKLEKWRIDSEFLKLRKLNARADWKKNTKATVNAYSHFLENSIELTAGILQSPFFDKDRPNYMNFASIGTTIGHEITHGFDDKGRQFDKDGNNKNWWEELTDNLYSMKVQCIIDQYRNYTTEIGMNINGVNTQGENIADNGAIKESYRAYQSWVKDNGQEQLLPGLKYNQNQLFWISSAYEWCAKYRPEELKHRIITNSHSPDEFRVTGPLSNFAEFARDFHCPSDSPMNSQHKCEVW